MKVSERAAVFVTATLLLFSLSYSWVCFFVEIVRKFCSTQLRRSVVKYGGRVGISQFKPSNCFRRLEKLVLPSIFDASLSSLMK